MTIRDSAKILTFRKGQESEEADCTIDETPNILVGESADHSGPYGKVPKIGCGQGPV